MKKGKLYRRILAVGMAFSLAAVPVSAMAESAEETEVLDVLEETVGDAIDEAVDSSAEKLASSAVETLVNVEFGDGMYNLYAEQGQDLSWLKNVSVYAQHDPDASGANTEFTITVNDTELLHVILTLDMELGILHIYVPELFDQTATIDLKAVMNSMMSGEQSSDSSDGSEDAFSPIMQMVTGIASQLAADAQEFFASIPAETWQEELFNYMVPVMSAFEQSEDDGTLTVLEMSRDVHVQTLTLSSESMAQLIPALLNQLAQDKVLEALFTSDFFNNALGMISMLTGSDVPSGEDLLAQVRSALDSLAASDYTGAPGFSVSTMNSDDGSGIGLIANMEANGETYTMLEVYAINDGEEHAAQISVGQFLLSMLGLQYESLNITLQGTNVDGYLNEEIDISTDGIYTCIINLEDIDLEALQRGETIGTVRIQIEGYDLVLTYNVEDDGTRTLLYTVNDEIFYNMYMNTEEVESTEIDQFDPENEVLIDSVTGLTEYLGTLNLQNLMDLAAEAGIPVGSDANGTVAA